MSDLVERLKLEERRLREKADALAGAIRVLEDDETDEDEAEAPPPAPRARATKTEKALEGKQFTSEGWAKRYVEKIEAAGGKAVMQRKEGGWFVKPVEAA